MLLDEARASAKRYDSYIKLAMKEQEPETMTFKMLTKNGLSQLPVSILLLDGGPATSLMKLFSHDLDSILRLKK
jgi:hypothetical protein